jgi:hypothetical protein
MNWTQLRALLEMSLVLLVGVSLACAEELPARCR